MISPVPDLLRMRDYIERHGFSPQWRYDKNACPQCFCGAISAFLWHPTIYYLKQFVGSVEEGDLRRFGWNKRDALAAIDIAIACAAPTP